ncbi:MAG: MFS transporter [Spirochaetales bacterium]|nr:MFS transporter [Spirochaetales bacterium]
MPSTTTSRPSGSKPARKPPLPRAIHALFLIRLVVSAGSFVQILLVMILTGKLGWSGSKAGVFMSVVAGLSALGSLAGGKLGDSFGRRRVLALLQGLAAALFLVSAVLGYGDWTPALAAAALALLAGSWPSINALAADHAPSERRREAFSLLYWGNNVGFALGAALAGFLYSHAPRALFAGNALALLLAALTATLFVPDRSARETVPDAATAAASGTKPGGAARGRGTLAIFRADPVLAFYGLLAVLTAFVYDQHRFALPLTLKEAFGEERGALVFSWAMSVNGLTVVAATALVVLASRRLSSLTAVALGSVFYAAGFGAYGLVAGVPAFLGVTAFWTLGEILGATNGNAFVAERAPDSHRGRVNGVLSLAYVLGGMISPLVAGPLADAFGARAIWAPIAVTSAVGAAGLFALSAWDRARGPGVRPSLASAGEGAEADGEGGARG